MNVNNNQQKQQTPVRHFDLLDKNVEIDPVGVVYNITGSAVEEFVSNYLAVTRNLDGIAAVRTKVIRDGATRPEINIYVMIDMNSNNVTSSLGNIPNHIARKLEEGNYRVSEKMKNALYPLCREFKVQAQPKEKLLIVKCDIFKVLGLMFAANPKIHAITISEIVKIKKRDSVMTVIKTNKFLDREDSASMDRYQAAIANLDD